MSNELHDVDRAERAGHDKAKAHTPKNVHADGSNRMTEIVTKQESNGV